jgi:SSS family solute:Na+ symporter
LHNFTAADSILLLIYIVFVVGIGISLRSSVKTSRDFFLAGRALPAWICALAFISVSLGAPQLIGISAMGAKYGLVAAQFYGIGAIPAMLFLGLYMMPVYYGSGARSVPDYLGLRFDAKTRTLGACLFLAMTIVCAGLSLCVLVRIVRALHLWDDLFPGLARSPQVVFAATVVVASVILLTYLIPGGLAAAMYNQAIQFCLVMAALLPVVFLGLRNIGGWSGLKTALAPGYIHEWSGLPDSMGVGIIGIVAGLGFALGFSYWCTDFSVLQAAFAARDVESARRVPLIAAIPKMLLPFLVIVPAMIAIALPTPHTTTSVTTTPEGAIIHNIQVVPPEVELGKGIIPAQIDPATRQPLTGDGGHTPLDFNAAIPAMFLHFFPTGILGLGLTALIAAFMSGLAGNITALSNVFTCDLFQPYLHKQDDDPQLLPVGRIAAGVAVALSIALAYALSRVDNYTFALQLIVSIVNAPLLGTILLGMFSRRTTGHGAFCGLLAGAAAAVVHHGLTLPIGLPAGIHGGWILDLHRYPSEIAQVFGGAISAFVVGFAVTGIISLLTNPRQASELVGMVHAAPVQHPRGLAWMKRPEALAIAILVAVIALSVFFA